MKGFFGKIKKQKPSEKPVSGQREEEQNKSEQVSSEESDLSAFSAFVVHPSSIQDILPDFLKCAHRFFSARGVAFWEYQAMSREFVLSYATTELSSLKKFTEEETVYLYRKFFSSKGPLMMETVPEFSLLLEATSSDRGFLSVLRMETHTFGLWAVFQPHRGSLENFQWLTQLLTKLWYQQRLKEGEEFSRKYRDFLRNIALFTSSGLDVEKVVYEILNKIKEFAGAKAVSVELWEKEEVEKGPARPELKLVSQVGLNGIAFWTGLPSSPSREVCNQGKPLVMALDSLKDLPDAIRGFERYLGLPLYAGGNLLGVLSLFAPSPLLLPVLPELLNPVVSLLANFFQQNRYFNQLRQKGGELAQLRKNLLSYQRELEILHREKAVLEHLKKEWLFSLSRELRIPFTVLQGAFALIEKGSHEPQSRELLMRGILQLSQFIEGISLMADIERGNLTFQLEEVSLKDLTEKVLEEVKPLAEEKHIQWVFTSNFPEEPIRVDHQKTQTALSLSLRSLLPFVQEESTLSISVQRKEEEELSRMEGFPAKSGFCLNFHFQGRAPSAEERLVMEQPYSLKGLYIPRYMLEKQGCYFRFSEVPEGFLLQICFPLIRAKKEREKPRIEHIVLVEPASINWENFPPSYHITRCQNPEEVNLSLVDLIILSGELNPDFWRLYHFAQEKKWNSSFLLLPRRLPSVFHCKAGLLSISHAQVEFPPRWESIHIGHPRELFAWGEFPTNFDVLVVLDFPFSGEVIQILNRFLSSGVGIVLTSGDKVFSLMEFLESVFSRMYVRI
ncbi:MAG: sensor histidine kinase [bacterium JZ-2024 1]